ncbi:MAG: Hsp20/alpha crystallin family protein [Anaerolineales bacterium]|nr:Hsp20/alpha crystallin family protein [Anaerolineales bacterium]
MSNLTRWDPFREMMTFRNWMDRMFESALSTPSWQPFTWDLALDVAETDDEFLVKASLPGINPDDLEITYNNNVLTIQGEIKEEKDVEQHRYHLRERRYGNFSRSISLPATVKADAIQATYEAGVLTLHLPKVEEAKPKRIAVKSVGAPQMIEGKAKEIASKN